MQVIVCHEDVNYKFLRSLSSEWSMHTVVWRNRSDLETTSLDDLYNNPKVYETEVKGSSSSSSGTKNQAFVSSNNKSFDSSQETFTTAFGVSAASS